MSDVKRSALEIAKRSEQLAYLSLLQSRIEVHGNRLWQLPFTYLGITSLTASIIFRENPQLHGQYLFLLLAAIGVVVVFCMGGAAEGYFRAASGMNDLEVKLGLPTNTKVDWRHWLPYFAITYVTAATCLIIWTSQFF